MISAGLLGAGAAAAATGATPAAPILPSGTSGTGGSTGAARTVRAAADDFKKDYYTCGDIDTKTGDADAKKAAREKKAACEARYKGVIGAAKNLAAVKDTTSPTDRLKKEALLFFYRSGGVKAQEGTVATAVNKAVKALLEEKKLGAATSAPAKAYLAGINVASVAVEGGVATAVALSNFKVTGFFEAQAITIYGGSPGKDEKGEDIPGAWGHQAVAYGGATFTSGSTTARFTLGLLDALFPDGTVNPNINGLRSPLNLGFDRGGVQFARVDNLSLSLSHFFAFGPPRNRVVTFSVTAGPVLSGRTKDDGDAAFKGDADPVNWVPEDALFATRTGGVQGGVKIALQDPFNIKRIRFALDTAASVGFGTAGLASVSSPSGKEVASPFSYKGDKYSVSTQLTLNPWEPLIFVGALGYQWGSIDVVDPATKAVTGQLKGTLLFAGGSLQLKLTPYFVPVFGARYSDVSSATDPAPYEVVALTGGADSTFKLFAHDYTLMGRVSSFTKTSDRQIAGPSSTVDDYYAGTDTPANRLSQGQRILYFGGAVKTPIGGSSVNFILGAGLVRTSHPETGIANSALAASASIGGEF